MTKKQDNDEYAKAVAAAVGTMISALHKIAAKHDLCALCIAHAFADYVDELEKRGVAKHVNVREENESETTGGTVH